MKIKTIIEECIRKNLFNRIDECIDDLKTTLSKYDHFRIENIIYNLDIKGNFLLEVQYYDVDKFGSDFAKTVVTYGDMKSIKCSVSVIAVE